MDAPTRKGLGLRKRPPFSGRQPMDWLPDRLVRMRETAYALACEVVAAEPEANQPILRMLEFVQGELRLDPLVAAAIERGTRARYRRVAAPA